MANFGNALQTQAALGTPGEYYYAPLPFKELAMAGASMQQRADANLGSLDQGALSVLSAKTRSIDAPELQTIYDQFTNEQAELLKKGMDPGSMEFKLEANKIVQKYKADPRLKQLEYLKGWEDTRNKFSSELKAKGANAWDYGQPYAKMTREQMVANGYDPNAIAQDTYIEADLDKFTPMQKIYTGIQDSMMALQLQPAEIEGYLKHGSLSGISDTRVRQIAEANVDNFLNNLPEGKQFAAQLKYNDPSITVEEIKDKALQNIVAAGAPHIREKESWNYTVDQVEAGRVAAKKAEKDAWNHIVYGESTSNLTVGETFNTSNIAKSVSNTRKQIEHFDRLEAAGNLTESDLIERDKLKRKLRVEEDYININTNQAINDIEFIKDILDLYQQGVEAATQYSISEDALLYDENGKVDPNKLKQIQTFIRKQMLNPEDPSLGDHVEAFVINLEGANAFEKLGWDKDKSAAWGRAASDEIKTALDEYIKNSGKSGESTYKHKVMYDFSSDKTKAVDGPITQYTNKLTEHILSPNEQYNIVGTGEEDGTVANFIASKGISTDKENGNYNVDVKMLKNEGGSPSQYILNFSPKPGEDGKVPGDSEKYTLLVYSSGNDASIKESLAGEMISSAEETLTYGKESDRKNALEMKAAGEWILAEQAYGDMFDFAHDAVRDQTFESVNGSSTLIPLNANTEGKGEAFVKATTSNRKIGRSTVKDTFYEIVDESGNKINGFDDLINAEENKDLVKNGGFTSIRDLEVAYYRLNAGKLKSLGQGK